MIIDASHFTGPIALANVSDTAPNSELLGNTDAIRDFIDRYEREALVATLGYSLYNDFQSLFMYDDINKTWTFVLGMDPEWNWLLYGRQYTINGKERSWRGLTYTPLDDGSATVYESPLAYYVYCKFIYSDYLSHTGTGFQKENAVNATGAGYARQYAYAWNKWVEMVEFMPYEAQDLQQVSLYDFMRDTQQLEANTFTDWNYKRFYLRNRFGL